MPDRYMITDGRRTCFLEMEDLRTGLVARENVWRQYRPFNKSLLENITGSWRYGDNSGFVERAPSAAIYRAPQLKLYDPHGRCIMEFADRPREEFSSEGEIIRPDGWRDKVVMSKVAYQVDLARAWMGLAFKGGGIAAVAGKDVLVGSLWNMGTSQVGFPFVATSSRVGIGLGGGAGLMIAVAYGFRDALGAVGTEFGGMDLGLALGGRWSAWLKSLRLANPKTASFAARVASLFMTESKIGIRGIADLMRLTSRFVHNEDAINMFKNVAGLSSFDDQDRCLVTFDIPMASAGLELSVYSASGKIVAVDMASAQKYLDELGKSAERGPTIHVSDARRAMY